MDRNIDNNVDNNIIQTEYSELMQKSYICLLYTSDAADEL